MSCWSHCTLPAAQGHTPPVLQSLFPRYTPTHHTYINTLGHEYRQQTHVFPGGMLLKLFKTPSKGWHTKCRPGPDPSLMIGTLVSESLPFLAPPLRMLHSPQHGLAGFIFSRGYKFLCCFPDYTVFLTTQSIQPITP